MQYPKPDRDSSELPTLSDVAYDPSDQDDASDAVFDAHGLSDDDGSGLPAAARKQNGGGLEDQQPALGHVQRAREVRFKRAKTSGKYLPSDPKPAPKRKGQDRHPDRGTYVAGHGTDPGIDRRASNGQFVEDDDDDDGQGWRWW